MNRPSPFPLATMVIAWFVLVILVLGSASSLPDTMAVHFGSNGQANGWMTRFQHLMSMLLLGTALPAFVIAICYAIRFFPPSLLNVPRPEYWRNPSHYPEACHIMLQWSYIFGALSAVWVALLHGLLVQANRSTPPVLSTSGTWGLSALYMTATSLSIAGLLYRFTRTEED